MKVYAVGGSVRDALMAALAGDSGGRRHPGRSPLRHPERSPVSHPERSPVCHPERSEGSHAPAGHSVLALAAAARAVIGPRESPPPDGASRDRDWVVVGATADDLLALGFRPVGRDFPVFLHPGTHEEHALARTERKTAPGYRGFAVHAAPTVTLDEDLQRRDLTINALALAEDGTLVDPWGGLRDLQAGVLRHVSPAFAEDPVRILRVARFAARWPRFVVADETMALMRRMVAAGEVDALVPERVVAEFTRGLMEPKPARMLEVLEACGALARVAPGVAGDALDAAQARLDRAAAADAPLPVRFAVFASACADAVALDRLLQALPVPAELADLARLLVAQDGGVTAALEAPTPAVLVDVLDACDAWRRPERVEALLQAWEVAHAPRAARALRRALKAARAVAAGPIAQAAPDVAAIGPMLKRARVEAVERAVGS